MSAWVQHHFQDAQHAREVIAVVAFVGGVIGFGMVMIGVFMPH